MSYKSKPLPLTFACAATESKLFPSDSGNEIALCGRSNSGKSTLINALANQKKLAKISNTPGRTQSINFFHLTNDEAKKYAAVLGYNYQSSEWYESSYKILNKDYKKSEIQKDIEKEKSLLKKFKDLLK